jgi:ABC-type branched-subunit amino acid transport system ATPase component/ABC-type branched-subunit amino acid transport system permease subunit
MRQKPGSSLAIIAALLAAWLALGFVIENSYYRLLLTIVPIWAVLAISWNVFSGYSGLVSFGHAAFFGLGAYTVTLCLVHWNITPWFGIPIGTLLGAIAGAAIGYPTFRLRGSYFALAMLAYPLALVYLFEWMGYQEVTLPIKREAPAWYMQFADQRVYLLLALGLLAAALVISLAIERSRFGMSLLAVKQNELAAEAAGVDTLRWKLRAIILSAALASAAGGLYAVVLLVVTPTSVFGLVVSAQAMILALFGGAGILWGPVIGAAVLVPMSEMLQATFGHLLPGIQGIVYGIAIILVILLAPEGIYWRVRDLFARRTKLALSPVAEVAKIVPAAPAPASRVRPIHPAQILEVRGISKSYGGLKAVHDVSFAVPEGSIVGIIGPNGAGKTTLFNLLNGLVKPDEGSVRFHGKDITSLKPNQVCRAGIGRTFQVVRTFPRMSVLENVVVGAYVSHATEDLAWRAARHAVDRVGMTARAEVVASALTNKELRLMELARALASEPKLVLMDEPLAGLGASETREVIALVRALPSSGVTVVIIEHTMHAMVTTVDSFVVLDHGQLLTEGPPAEVTRNPQVIEAYLGHKWAMKNVAS